MGIIFDDRFELRLDRFLTVIVSVDVGWTPTQNADVHVVLVDGFDELADRHKSDHFVSISDLELLAQFAADAVGVAAFKSDIGGLHSCEFVDIHCL